MIITLQTLIFFRESLISVIERIIRPYYKRLTLQFKVNDISDQDEEDDEQVYAEFDGEKGVVFFPPVYAQRYAAVADCLMDERWCGQLEKVVDFGYHDMSFIKYLKDLPGIKHILGVDLETIPLRCSSDLLGCDNYVTKRESPLQVTLFKGNAADPDYRLIGCDAVIAIEMIEHMLPHDLERFVHTVFGFIKPRIAVITTPNGDFNVLFKALEKNGYRRLDHYFEWSREQFHDWCSNIVTRYPQYTVVSKGIGPGPPDTSHLGCCSQLALFIAKDYQKQPDLNLNSLALVPKAPSHNNLSDLTDSWETPDSISDNMLCLEDNDESFTKLLMNQSYMTIVITTPSLSLGSSEYHDKILQCNLDSEWGKNFIMFDDEMFFNILLPRRKKFNAVYEIEDVASRLNCSTLQVKKFSKVTQGLLAKNKIDSFAHTREVVDEIRNLTKKLNFNRNQLSEKLQGSHIWYNFNWGDNAPYWNQYYKIIREYTYPFEVKSIEGRIVDAISEEISRIVESEEIEEVSTDSHKLEIPIGYLMRTLEHITTDVDKVKDLLEWNGYEIVDDKVIYCRLVVDTISVDSQDDWRDDALSDWETTDNHSTALSDGSLTVPDYYDRGLRRALDQKLRNLRTLITADEDITTELDRIVCRLMKLALHTSTGSKEPPSSSWMQWKLFDLLALTEKAIEKRRVLYFENFPLKAIEYYNEQNSDKNTSAINTLKEDDNTVQEIVSKYCDVVGSSDFKTNEAFQEDQLSDFEFNDIVSATSNEFREMQEYEYDYNDMHANNIIIEEMENNKVKCPIRKSSSIKATKPERLDLENQNTKVVPHRLINSGYNTSDESTNYTMLRTDKHENGHPEKNISSDSDNYEMFISKLTVYKGKRIHNPSKYYKQINENGCKNKSKTKITKKVSSKILNGQYKIKRRKTKEHQKLQSTLSKPIPDSLIKLCSPEHYSEKNIEEIHKELSFNNAAATDDMNELLKLRNISATEESVFVGIVSEYGEETIALRRNVGVDPDKYFDIVDNEAAIETVINVTKDDDFLSQSYVNTENVMSQAIFIYDINEPSTSKGIQHLSTDAQCGPDVSLTCAAISATTSLTVVPNIFTNSVKIKDSSTQVNKKTSEFGTCTELLDSGTRMSIGIKIKDSDHDLHGKPEFSVITQALKQEDLTFQSNSFDNRAKLEVELDAKPQCSIMTQALERENLTIKSNFSDNYAKAEAELGAKPQCPIMTQALVHENLTVKSNSSDNYAKTEAELKIPVSSIHKTKDSNSELCGSILNFPKSILYPVTLAKHASNLQIESISKEEDTTPRNSRLNYIKKDLICGGIHVHSYKERVLSEDVVYQGEWQRTQSLGRKKPQDIKNIRSKSPPKKRKLSTLDNTNAVVVNNLGLNKTNKCSIKPTLRNAKVDNLNNTVYKIDRTNNIKNINIGNTIKINKIVVKATSLVTISSRKTKKPTYTKQKPLNKRTIIDSTPTNQKKEVTKNCLKKNYIPMYLRKITQDSYTKNYSKNESHISIVKCEKRKSLLYPMVDDIKKDLLKFTEKVHSMNNYMVFRNENETKSSASKKPPPIAAEVVHNNTTNSNHSPPSRNSSTCSSPNSVATVRAVLARSRPVSSRRDSPSSDKSNSEFQSQSKSLTKNKNYSKYCKTNKKSPNKVTLVGGNKENVPESSKNINSSKNDISKTSKCAFIGNTKSVFMLQATTDTAIQQSNPAKDIKNNLKNISLQDNIKNNELVTNLYNESPSNKILRQIECKNDNSCTLDSYNACDLEKKANESLPTNKNTYQIPDIQDSPIKSSHATKSCIMSAIRQLIEEQINVTENSSHDSIVSESETIILNREDDNNNNNNSSFDSSLSPVSIKTVLSKEDVQKNDVESSFVNVSKRNDENESFSSIADVPLNVDFDTISVKSSDVSSISTSKFSEYYLADNELDNTIFPQIDSLSVQFNNNSLQDLFERKDRDVTNIDGLLAVQAFSGFSINAGSFVGDLPDNINLLDNETGNITLDSGRHATSEELFVSGRSSDTYESCLFEEDTYVPSWLFNIISQQHSNDESEVDEALLPMQIPLVEPEFDINENVMEPDIGVGAGAGDGRGMHSDQDSSGRGTSLSSSATSSGQNEAILIDLSAINPHSTDHVCGTVNVRNISNINNEINEANTLNGEGIVGGSAENSNYVQFTSDVDADVSSLDTDAIDSDN